ncbi:Mitochondrial ATPase complex subunit atp10 [Arachnomyces sp. PD_36]|nr:Mitochondrial ATPase complex subunit atp10 [Arachnomyces sp. PD_36]
MWKPSTSSLLIDAPLAFQSGRCLQCQYWRVQPKSFSRFASNKPSIPLVDHKSNLQPPTPKQQSPQPPAKSGGRNGEEFTPKPLARPLGVQNPPQPGQNTGIETRTLRERRDDFVNYEKHVERRRELTKQVAKPYFREWSDLRHHKGKSFISNSRLFRGDKALYFPNLAGSTLASPKVLTNTTPILKGKVSVVSVFNGLWAERQVATFVRQPSNPDMYKALEEGGDLAQRVEINVEDNTLKAWLIRMFMWRMRQTMPKEQHERYFLIRKGFVDRLKEAIGMINGKVGYVYLLDENCRIRWAGSGNAEGDELEGLNNGIRKLVEEKKRHSAPWAAANDGSRRVVTPESKPKASIPA